MFEIADAPPPRWLLVLNFVDCEIIFTTRLSLPSPFVFIFLFFIFNLKCMLRLLFMFEAISFLLSTVLTEQLRVIFL